MPPGTLRPKVKSVKTNFIDAHSKREMIICVFLCFECVVSHVNASCHCRLFAGYPLGESRFERVISPLNVACHTWMRCAKFEFVMPDLDDFYHARTWSARTATEALLLSCWFARIDLLGLPVHTARYCLLGFRVVICIYTHAWIYTYTCITYEC